METDMRSYHVTVTPEDATRTNVTEHVQIRPFPRRRLLSQNVNFDVSLLTTSRVHTARNVEQLALLRATLSLKRDVVHGITANSLPSHTYCMGYVIHGVTANPLLIQLCKDVD